MGKPSPFNRAKFGFDHQTIKIPPAAAASESWWATTPERDFTAKARAELPRIRQTRFGRSSTALIPDAMGDG